MLTYPDRQKFEQIRARWETAQPGEERPAEMVGWRDRTAAQQPANVESQENGSSKFRRKLSHGLAFISNPLSQRKTTPGRHQVKRLSLAVTEPSVSDVTSANSTCDALISPPRKSTPTQSPEDSPTREAVVDASPQSAETNATPKPLPRSRTLSFIPLPVRAESDTFASDVEGAVKSHSLAVMPPPEPEPVPSKIPTPSPPLPERRRSSPRQYLHQHASYHASQQIKHIAAAHAFAAANNGSPGRPLQPLRSRTTPNLMKVPNAPQQAGFMAPRRPGPKRPIVSPRAHKPALQENVPIDRRVTHRRSQIQERPLKRESLAMPGALNNRRSFGPGTPLAQSRNSSFATPPTVRKRVSSHLAQSTPVTAKRVQASERASLPPPPPPKPSPVMESDPVPQARLPSSPATPTTRNFDFEQPTLPRSHTDRDLQRKTLGTPNGLGGVWRSSRALAVTTHEVSRLPRSHTFHDFGTRMEDAPPVPPIPIHYKAPSLADLTQRSRMRLDTPIKARHGRMVSDATSCQSIPEETKQEVLDSTTAYTSFEDDKGLASPVKYDGSTISLTAFPSVPTTIPSRMGQRPFALGEEPSASQDDPFRPSSGGLELLLPEIADVGVVQVKDYMPPLYWAGRFQSRYDQWRTDAMNAVLNMSSDRQPSSPLSECKLDQDRLAACYILAQLRDLCTSDQAADSLWVGINLFIVRRCTS